LKKNGQKSKRGGKRTGAGRPKGARNKATADVKEAAQVYTTEALETLAEVMRDKSIGSARVAASKELLDRGYGKSAQPQTGEGGTGPIHHVISWMAPQ